MSEDKYSDGVSKTRPALGDVTNRVTKRGFSQISGTSDVKSGNGYGENLKNKEVISKKACGGEENYRKQGCASTRACVSPYTCSEINSLKGNVISSISKIQTEIKKPDSPNCCLNIGCENKDFLDARGERCEEEGISSEVAQGNSLIEQLGNSFSLNDGNDLNLDDLDSTKCGSIEFSRLPESQESRASGLERCVGLKGDGPDGCSDSNAGVDLIKSCSCSFCTKDLHYQDIKGRIAGELVYMSIVGLFRAFDFGFSLNYRLSQKEANVLVQRSLRSQGIEQHHGLGNSNKISKLESDLMGQWRSLFLHMEDIFGRENSQLESSLFTLKDLRDNCKTELESTNGSSSGKQ
ncbi:hypothetical protein LguiB_016406 [Lonicera macranthoides]